MEIYVYKNLNSIVAHRWRYIKDYDSFISSNALNLVYQNKDFNFCYRDYVYTDIIINTGDQYLTSNTQLTYVIVKAGNNDYSSWYVLNTDQVRGNQYKLHLQRDVLNDYATILKDLQYNINRCFYQNIDYAYINDFIYSHLKNEDNYFLQNKNELLYDEKELIYDFGGLKTVGYDFILLGYSDFISQNKADNADILKVKINFDDGFYIVFLNENMEKEFSEMVFGTGGISAWHLYNSDLNNITFGASENGHARNSIFGFQDKSAPDNIGIWDIRDYPEPYFIALIPKSIYSYALKKNIDISNTMAQLKEKFGDNILDIQYSDLFNFQEQINFNRIYTDIKCFDVANFFATIVNNKITSIYPIFAVKNNLCTVSLQYINTMSKNLTSLKVYNTKYSFRIVNYTQDNSFDFKFIDWLTDDNYFKFLISNYMRPYNPTITFNVADNTTWISKFKYDDKDFYFTDTSNKSTSLNTSQFEQYALDNKNYQNIFNRQLQSQDISFAIGQAQSTISNTMQVAKGASQLASGISAGFGLSNIMGGISNQLQQPLEIANYFNSRQTQIDTFNMQIDNIKNRADKPIINTFFSKSFYYHYMVKIYKDTDENIEEYKRFLNERGILWNVKHIDLKSFFTNIKISDFSLVTGSSYIKCEVDFEKYYMLNYLNNRVLNEINTELSNGVYMDKEVFNLITNK